MFSLGFGRLRTIVLKVSRLAADTDTTSSSTEFSGNQGFSGWDDFPGEFLLRPFSQEGLRVMSHDAEENRLVHEPSRRRVRFQAMMEDLEGRVLLSGVHHYRAPQGHVRVMHVRVMHARVVHAPKVQVWLSHRTLISYAQSLLPTI